MFVSQNFAHLFLNVLHSKNDSHIHSILPNKQVKVTMDTAKDLPTLTSSDDVQCSTLDLFVQEYQSCDRVKQLNLLRQLSQNLDLEIMNVSSYHECHDELKSWDGRYATHEEKMDRRCSVCTRYAMFPRSGITSPSESLTFTAFSCQNNCGRKYCHECAELFLTKVTCRSVNDDDDNDNDHIFELCEVCRVQPILTGRSSDYRTGVSLTKGAS